MRKRFFVTGTDTGVGKTIISMLLMHHNPDFMYWKPVQSGLEESTDTESLIEMGGIPTNRIIPEAIRLKAPRSPHEAAALEGKVIHKSELIIPEQFSEKPLIIEGAGGLLVPINDKLLMIDLISFYEAETILVARSGLGTLNHTLLSLEALRRRNIPVRGVVLNGSEHPSNRETIKKLGNVAILAEVEPFTQLDSDTLKNARFQGLVI